MTNGNQSWLVRYIGPAITVILAAAAGFMAWGAMKSDVRAVEVEQSKQSVRLDKNEERDYLSAQERSGLKKGQEMIIDTLKEIKDDVKALRRGHRR